jgi:hypothetical protein
MVLVIVTQFLAVIGYLLWHYGATTNDIIAIKLLPGVATFCNLSLIVCFYEDYPETEREFLEAWLVLLGTVLIFAGEFFHAYLVKHGTHILISSTIPLIGLYCAVRFDSILYKMIFKKLDSESLIKNT